MVTQHEFDTVAREVLDIGRRLMLTEGRVIALQSRVAELETLVDARDPNRVWDRPPASGKFLPWEAEPRDPRPMIAQAPE